MAIAFKSINKAARTATFDVDGQSITRKIPAKFEGTIDEHLKALAEGLYVEAKLAGVKAIKTPTTKADDILVADAEEVTL